MLPFLFERYTLYQSLLLIAGLQFLLAQPTVPTVRLPTAPQSAPSVRLPTVPQNVPSVRLPTAPMTPVLSQAPSPSGGIALPTVALPSTRVPGPTSNETVQPTTFQPTTTYSPTITPFPTISSFPTGSPAPTSELCNVCITGEISVNDLLPLPNGNVSCAEVAAAGKTGQLNPSNCMVLQNYIADNNLCACIGNSNATTPTFTPTAAPFKPNDPCFICGEGNIVSIADGLLPLPNSTLEPLHCSFVQTGGEFGLLDPELCAYFSDLAQNTSDPCGCVPDPTTPSPAGTEAPTSVFPSCYVCINETERVTSLDTIVSLPEEVIAALADDIDPSILTCEFVDMQGRYNNSFDRLVCSFLQMAVSDVCACQEIDPTSVPVPPPAPDGSSPTPSNSGNPSSSAIAVTTALSEMVLLALCSFYIL